MSVKNLLVLSAAALTVVGASAALAGGPDHMAMAAAAPASQNSVYVDLHAGYAQSNWTENNTNGVMGGSRSSVGGLFAPSSNGKGGFTGAADLGYNFTQNVALEAGWFYLPEVKGNVTSIGRGVAAAGSTAKVNSWFAYTAAKLSVPVMENVDLFGKVGVAYRELSYDVPATVSALGATGTGNYWSPIFGAGLEYTLGSWLVGAQYTYLPSNEAVNRALSSSTTLAGCGAPNAAPDVNLYTAFLGYTFNV